MVSALVVTTTIGSVTTPGPASTGGSGGSSGLSPTSKKVIGGVVGGIAGAVVLAGIALVCWRLWGRDKYDPNQDLDFATGTGQGLGPSPGGAEKVANLAQDEAHADRYTSPPKPNAAANF